MFSYYLLKVCPVDSICSWFTDFLKFLNIILPQDNNRILRNQLLSPPIVFLSFFSHFLLSYFEYFSDCTEHISLIPYQIPSVGLSFHPHFTILTSSAVLDRLNICSRRKTRVYVSLAYAETISIR